VVSDFLQYAGTGGGWLAQDLTELEFSMAETTATVATIAQMKGLLAFTSDVGSTDDDTLQRLLDAAQSYVEVWIGGKIDDLWGGIGQDPIPAAITQAVIQLASHWWEIRGHEEAMSLMKTAPAWVEAIITSFRNWTF
jgi:hypothetical protein